MNTLNERLVIGGVAAAIGLLIGWTVHGLTGYARDTETVTSFQDWRVQCPVASAKDQHCALVQETVNTQNRNPIARITIGQEKDKQVVMFHLPLGVALQQGINFNMGTEPVKLLPYRVCYSTCIVEVPLDAGMQASLDAGKDGQFSFLFNAPDAKPISVPVSMKGFKEAQSAYRRLESKRSSWFWRMW